MHPRRFACEGSHASTADKLEYYYRLKNACERVLGDRVCPEQREQDREHAEECLPARRLLRSSHGRQTASACSCRYAREVNEMDCFRCYYRP